jgi:hypothetical protein
MSEISINIRNIIGIASFGRDWVYYVLKLIYLDQFIMLFNATGSFACRSPNSGCNTYLVTGVECL